MSPPSRPSREVDVLDICRHWIAEYEDERGVLHQSVIRREDAVKSYAGQTISGPYVLEPSPTRGAVDAERENERLRALLDLHGIEHRGVEAKLIEDGQTLDESAKTATDRIRGAVSASELLATLEREAPDDDAPTAYRNGYDAALMTARMVVGSASDRPQGTV